MPGPVLLFRYSALTGNGHRIHYDLDYVTREEGYPGLVVHGPLQATWLADLALRHRGGTLRRFAFRGRRPAFHDNILTLAGWEADGVTRLETRDNQGQCACRPKPFWTDRRFRRSRGPVTAPALPVLCCGCEVTMPGRKTSAKWHW